jgi:hypothetical protein
LATVLRVLRGPYHLGTNSDPDYAYLFNSLNIVSLQAPDMIEHPGTTIEVLGALVILAKWIQSRLISGTNIQDSVLSNPEDYLTAINVVLTILIVTATFVVGLQVLRISRSVFPALAVQLSLLLFTQIPMALPKVSPEPLLIVATLILIPMLMRAVTNTPEDPVSHKSHSVWVGVAMGFGLATKFTFLPLLGFAMLLHGWSRRATALVACALAFVVFTAPIWPKYGFLRDWLVILATHKGVNGAGESGLPDASALYASLTYLISVASPLFMLLGLYLVALVVLRLWNPGLPARELVAIRQLLLVSSFVLGAQIALSTKNVGAHYLLPSMVACGLTNAVLILALVRNVPKGLALVMSRAVVAGAISIAVMFAAREGIELTSARIADAEEALRFERVIALKEASVVAYYRSSLPQYALAFGNDFAKARYNGALSALYPDAVFYSIWAGQFYSFRGDIPEEEILKLLKLGRTVLLYGSPFVGDYGAYRKRLVLEPVLVESREALYLLTGIDQAR